MIVIYPGVRKIPSPGININTSVNADFMVNKLTLLTVDIYTINAPKYSSLA
jgi:hypothetical protein